jgi:hypothetical protein
MISWTNRLKLKETGSSLKLMFPAHITYVKEREYIEKIKIRRKL